MIHKTMLGLRKTVVTLMVLSAIALLTGCAYVIQGYQLYPIGVSVRAKTNKSIYIQPAFDKRPDNVKAAMFLGDVKPTKYITRYEQEYYFVEDPAVQTMAEYFTGAVQNDFRDAGFTIANSKSSADYVLMMQINKMEGYKEMNVLSEILGIFTLGYTTHYDIVTSADVNVFLMDAKTNQKIFGKRYDIEETKEQYIYSPYIYNTEYYLTKQIKEAVKRMLTDVIRTVQQ